MLTPSPVPFVHPRVRACSPTHSLSLLFLNLDPSSLLPRIPLQNIQISRDTRWDVVDAQEVEVTGWDLGFLWSAQEGTQGHFLNRGHKTPGRPSPQVPRLLGIRAAGVLDWAPCCLTLASQRAPGRDGWPSVIKAPSLPLNAPRHSAE